MNAIQLKEIGLDLGIVPDLLIELMDKRCKAIDRTKWVTPRKGKAEKKQYFSQRTIVWKKYLLLWYVMILYIFINKIKKRVNKIFKTG